MLSVIDYQWSAGLKDIKFNEGYKYVLVVIDFFQVLVDAVFKR